jgi:hypothetical protein
MMSASVPVIAKMKVIIGNVTLELKNGKEKDGYLQNIKRRTKIIPLSGDFPEIA